MSEHDRASCRRAAEECIELARIATDPVTKEILLTRGQEWLKLAYSDHDAEFERLLTEFNTEQMGFFDRVPPPEGADAAAGGAAAARQAQVRRGKLTAPAKSSRAGSHRVHSPCD